MKTFISSTLTALLILAGVAWAIDSNEEISITQALTEAEAVAAERQQAQEGETPETPETTDPAEDATDPAQEADAGGGISTLITLLESAGMFETLDSEGPYTLFAPTNAAFENLEEGRLEELQADQAMLQQLLELHVVEGAYTIEELQDTQTVQAINGETLTVHLEADGLEVNDASFSATDVNNLYANGVIHVVEEVILPAEAGAEQPRGQEQSQEQPAEEEDAGGEGETPQGGAGSQ